MFIKYYVIITLRNLCTKKYSFYWVFNTKFMRPLTSITILAVVLKYEWNAILTRNLSHIHLIIILGNLLLLYSHPWHLYFWLIRLFRILILSWRMEKFTIRSTAGRIKSAYFILFFWRYALIFLIRFYVRLILLLVYLMLEWTSRIAFITIFSEFTNSLRFWFIKYRFWHVIKHTFLFVFTWLIKLA